MATGRVHIPDYGGSIPPPANSKGESRGDDVSDILSQEEVEALLNAVSDERGDMQKYTHCDTCRHRDAAGRRCENPGIIREKIHPLKEAWEVLNDAGEYEELSAMLLVAMHNIGEFGLRLPVCGYNLRCYHEAPRGEPDVRD